MTIFPPHWPALVAQAQTHLTQAATPQGLLAALDATDNYRRIWARDGIIAGLAGLAAGHPDAEAGLAATLRTLAAHQAPPGQIPSNVPLDPSGQPSYGGLAGRVDATAWFVVGAGLLGLRRDPPGFRNHVRPHVRQALAVMQAWEFNERHLMYVPISGNWADEYPVGGYLLYDQLVRLWGLELAAEYWQMPDWAAKAAAIRTELVQNYDLSRIDVERGRPGVRHPGAMEAAARVPYWPCGFSPSGYDTRFDLAANALALLLGLGQGTPGGAHGIAWLQAEAEARGHWCFPAFAPVILPGQPEWPALARNHAYRFKNHPHHFHNGGVWPVWLGWLAAGLAAAGQPQAAAHVAHSMAEYLHPNHHLPEYLAGDSLQPGGMPHLSYTASGILLADMAAHSPNALSTFFRSFAS